MADKCVVRNAQYRRGGLNKRERHNERKNADYQNEDIIKDRAAFKYHRHHEILSGAATRPAPHCRGHSRHSAEATRKGGAGTLRAATEAKPGHGDVGGIMMIDEKTVEQARNADIITFFERRYGFTFAHRGGAYRCQQHPSLAVKNDRRSWYWHSKGVGGCGTLDYLIKAENMPFREAVEAAAGIAPATAQPRQEAEQPKTLVLPAKKEVSLRLYQYLCGWRGIDSEVVNTLIQKGKLYEDRRGNVVFVGQGW